VPLGICRAARMATGAVLLNSRYESTRYRSIIRLG